MLLNISNTKRSEILKVFKMKELANFTLESAADNGWFYRDGFLEKHLDQTTISIQENQETHDFTAYVTHYVNPLLVLKEDETNTFKQRVNLAKKKIIYLGRIVDETLIDKEMGTKTNIKIELYNVPAIICKTTFKEKLNYLQKSFFNL